MQISGLFCFPRRYTTKHSPPLLCRRPLAVFKCPPLGSSAKSGPDTPNPSVPQQPSRPPRALSGTRLDMQPGAPTQRRSHLPVSRDPGAEYSAPQVSRLSPRVVGLLCACSFRGSTALNHSRTATAATHAPRHSQPLRNPVASPLDPRRSPTSSVCPSHSTSSSEPTQVAIKGSAGSLNFLGILFHICSLLQSQGVQDSCRILP